MAVKNQARKAQRKNIKRRRRLAAKHADKMSYKNNLIAMIRTFDDIVLTKKCTEVKEQDDLVFIDTMKKVLRATKYGVGLSASQIGITKQAFVTRFDHTLDQFLTFINPEIIEQSEETAIDTEGCLSYPNIYCEVERSVSIKIKYLDLNRKEHTREFSGFQARVVLHEYDHTQGRCSVKDEWEKTKK